MNNKAMYNLTYGLFLLTAKDGDKDNGCIINTAIQVANDPTRISIAVINKNHTCDLVKTSGEFNISALTKSTPFALFQRFGMQSGRDVNKFADYADVARSENGLYYLTQHANAFLSAKVVDQMDLGSHTLFIAEVTDGEVLSTGESCTYGFYQSDIKPKPAAAAPTAAKRWVCSVCGHVYEGDVIPDDYKCPLCNHGKEDFNLVSETAPAAAAPAAPTVSVPASGSGKYVCMVCGYVHEGDAAPEACPVCKAPAAKFVKQDAEMTWAAEHVVGVAQGSSEDIMNDLRANFTGECTEVGMYLAMARVAHREGYPEIGAYYEKAAYEEAEHAAKFAELLGEVITNSTKKNLELRIEAENGATAGKTDLAKRAKAANLDAIHDTVHEMARDEARHGKAFKGLHDRYFGK